MELMECRCRARPKHQSKERKTLLKAASSENRVGPADVTHVSFAARRVRIPYGTPIFQNPKNECEREFGCSHVSCTRAQPDVTNEVNHTLTPTKTGDRREPPVAPE